MRHSRETKKKKKKKRPLRPLTSGVDIGVELDEEDEDMVDETDPLLGLAYGRSKREGEALACREGLRRMKDSSPRILC